MPTLGPSAISGACAGLVSSIITCPLDVVKTKLQAQTSTRASSATPAQAKPLAAPGAVSHPSLIDDARRWGKASGAEEGQRVYKGLVGTLRTIYRDEGIKGFYRGLGPTIFGYLPTWAIYFTVYDGCKGFLASRGGTREGAEEGFLDHIVAAMTAGAASTVCTSPLWVVKTRFMLQSTSKGDPSGPKPYKHTLDAFVRIFQTEGIQGFYRGLLPSLMGVSHVAVQFPLYETFKSLAKDSLVNEETGELRPKVILACSSSAKMIASVLTYPHEVVRTRLQMQPRTRAQLAAGGIVSSVASTPSQSSSSAAASSSVSARQPPSISTPPTQQKYTTLFRTIQTITREEGLRGFYNGMGVNLIRTVPSSALTILTYEVMMQHLNNSNSSGNSAGHQTAETDDG